MDVTETETGPTHARRARVFLGIALAAAAGLYWIVAMPGMDHTSEPMAGMEHPSVVQLEGLAPEDFVKRIQDDVYLVNVHVPAGESIEGTDAVIPYDAIVRDARIPDDRSTPILLYCKTGQMSQSALRALRNAGYNDVAYLDGGTDAWRVAGRSLIPS